MKAERRVHSTKSDVFLFLRREERGRGVGVPQDGQGAFLERDPAEDSASRRFHSATALHLEGARRAEKD